MTADVKTTVEKVINTLNTEIMANIMKSFDADKAEMKAIMLAFTVCERTRAGKVGAINSFTNKFDRKYKELQKCILGIKGEYNKEKADEACKHVKIGLKGNKKLKCDEEAVIQDSFPKYPPECRDKKKLGYAGWIYWNHEALKSLLKRHDDAMQECSKAGDDLDVKEKECKNTKTLYLNKKKVCKDLQTLIETTTCTRLSIIKETRVSYPHCYNDALAQYKKLTVLLRGSEIERTDQWRALKRITCFLGVFTLDAEDKSAKITKCREKVFTTDEYNLVLQPAPAMLPPPKQLPFACTPEYVAKYYDAKKLGGKIEKQCEWCGGNEPTPPPTPMPTADPTPFPTPEATAKPTPPPTKARGEGCKITFFIGKNFGGGVGKTLKWTNPKDNMRRLHYVTGAFNDKIKSWKAKGDQCKFCFYEDSNNKGKLLGSRRAVKEKDAGAALLPTSSIIIIDTRFTKFCPDKKMGVDMKWK